ncbi:MAG: hypothetical protein ACK5MR_02115 [Cumulibacter sp.]
MTLFRGTGTAACRYLESDRSTADDYYLVGGTALAEFTLSDSAGEVVTERTLGHKSTPRGWAGPTRSAVRQWARHGSPAMGGAAR